MAAATLTLLNPVNVIGGVRLHVYNVGSIADTNTLTVTNLSFVLGAWLQPEVQLTSSPGIALSAGAGTTLTFSMSATITAGKLFVLGQ